MTLFFRKERPDVFESRFEKIPNEVDGWRVNSGNVVLQAKKTEREVTVLLAGQRRKILCKLSGTNIEFYENMRLLGTIMEAAMPGLVSQATSTDVKVHALRELSRLHATASTNSILVSGCVLDNFAASRTYPGYKLCFELRSRIPFTNPFASGLERECFLVGKVSSADCNSIKYCGATKKVGDTTQDATVDGKYVSQIPHAPEGGAATNRPTVGQAPSRIPVRT